MIPAGTGPYLLRRLACFWARTSIVTDPVVSLLLGQPLVGARFGSSLDWVSRESSSSSKAIVSANTWQPYAMEKSLSLDNMFVFLMILGLRSLYLAAHGLLARLRHLHYGLSAVLGFAAFKLIASDIVEVSPLASVGIIVACICVSAIASRASRGKRRSISAAKR